ncbi:MAG: NAD(P)H-dependent glycerol-3-phosphate dehydrogenase [Planctomycetota bacterium]
MDTAPRTITILGVGQMGLVCAGLLTANSRPAGDIPPDVRMWGHDPDECDHLAQARESGRLENFRLADSVRVCAQAKDALADTELIVSAIPVQFTRAAWAELRQHVPAKAAVVSVAKGIENGTLLRPTQIVADALADDPDGSPRPFACLSGPTIATELARCLPATMIAASDREGFAGELQQLFSTSYMRIYTNPDLLGVELAGATKNVIAIAAGIIDGLAAGSNAKSALLSRGLAEIARLGAAMGASPETFFGVADLGDLATTCFSPEGRNRSCGEALGRGTRLEDYLASSTSVVEGVATTQSVVDLAERFRVDMPITRAVHAVLHGGLDPIEAIGRLMSRDLRDERLA